MPAGAAKLVTANLMVSDAADSLSAVVNVTVVAGAPASLELYELVQGHCARFVGGCGRSGIGRVSDSDCCQRHRWRLTRQVGRPPV
jgi:hypothetical protein